MPESQYSKYIIKRPKASVPIQETEFSKLSVYVDEEVVPGAYYLMGNWIMKPPDKGSPAEEHDHEFDEYLGFIGTNPDDVFDLGGEIELWLGGEKHIITESCVIFIPAGLKHAPIYFRRVDRPIWYMATGPVNRYAKKINE
jgi:hypothetical protein